MTKQDTDARGGQTERGPRIWELVPVADYRLPPTPAAQAAQARWVSLKRLFAGQRHEHEAPVRAEADLRRLPEQQLDALVATINWGPGAKVLQRALETWDADNEVHFLIAPPRSGQVELLRRWATENGARWIDPPKYQDILEAGPAWLAGWPSDASHWVLTQLEHCWLRHPAGLALLRELLDRALSGRLGRGVIGCDSWAWAYLRYVAPLPTPSAMTLQAFDGKRLAALLRDLVTVEAPGQVHFCDARTGKRVLAVDGEDDDDGGAELQSLAARCGGNAGLARELWRARLRAEPTSESGTDEDTADQDAGPAADGHNSRRAWGRQRTPGGHPAQGHGPRGRLLQRPPQQCRPQRPARAHRPRRISARAAYRPGGLLRAGAGCLRQVDRPGRRGGGPAEPVHLGPDLAGGRGQRRRDTSGTGGQGGRGRHRRGAVNIVPPRSGRGPR